MHLVAAFSKQLLSMDESPLVGFGGTKMKEAQSQASPKAQPPGPTTSSAPSACEEASSTPAMDSTLEAPMNPATPAASEGEGPSGAPREEAPGAGPT